MCHHAWSPARASSWPAASSERAEKALCHFTAARKVAKLLLWPSGDAASDLNALQKTHEHCHGTCHAAP